METSTAKLNVFLWSEEEARTRSPDPFNGANRGFWSSMALTRKEILSQNKW